MLPTRNLRFALVRTQYNHGESACSRIEAPIAALGVHVRCAPTTHVIDGTGCNAVRVVRWASCHARRNAHRVIRYARTFTTFFPGACYGFCSAVPGYTQNALKTKKKRSARTFWSRLMRVHRGSDARSATPWEERAAASRHRTVRRCRLLTDIKNRLGFTCALLGRQLVPDSTRRHNG